MTNSLTEFLLARITEDEAAALKMAGVFHSATTQVYAGDAWINSPLTLDRFLAECAAKRAIVAECRPGTLDDLDGSEDDSPAPMWVARAIAAVYADHPDYLPEWSA